MVQRRGQNFFCQIIEPTLQIPETSAPLNSSRFIKTLFFLTLSRLFTINRISLKVDSLFLRTQLKYQTCLRTRVSFACCHAYCVRAWLITLDHITLFRLKKDILLHPMYNKTKEVNWAYSFWLKFSLNPNPNSNPLIERGRRFESKETYYYLHTLQPHCHNPYFQFWHRS